MSAGEEQGVVDAPAHPDLRWVATLFFCAISQFGTKQGVGRVSAATHSPKSAPLSDSTLLPQLAGSHPCLTYRWKLEYGQWLTCATMLHRVPMNVIDMPVEVGLIADEMFPESMLPQRDLVPLCAAPAHPFRSIESGVTALRDHPLNDAPASGIARHLDAILR